jgi:hypothetical protein
MTAAAAGAVGGSGFMSWLGEMYPELADGFLGKLGLMGEADSQMGFAQMGMTPPQPALDMPQMMGMMQGTAGKRHNMMNQMAPPQGLMAPDPLQFGQRSPWGLMEY